LSEGFAFKIFLLHTQQPKTWMAWYTGLPSMLQQTLWQKRGRAETSDEVPGLLFLAVLFLSETDNSETSLSTTVDSSLEPQPLKPTSMTFQEIISKIF
jgi:hypothetical protein